MLDLRAPARVSTRRVLIAWSALIVVAFVWGRILVLTHHDLFLGTPPFWSRSHLHVSLRVVPAVVVSGVIIRYGPQAARTWSWRAVLASTAIASTVWAVAMAYVDGPHALTALFAVQRFDYLQTAQGIHSIHTYLSQFVDKIATYNQNTIGHPPAMVVIEWVMSRVGFATPGWNAALTIGGGVTAGSAALVAYRDVAGEDAARGAAAFLALVPAVLWWQTADAFFAGVSATAVMLIVLASSRGGRRADLYALAGGLLFGLTLFLSYGLALIALLPIAVCWARRRFRPLLVAAVGIIPFFVGFAATGFSWFAGFAATRHEYWIGAASQRPYSYFLIADLAVLAIATGPAVAVALTRLRDRQAWLLVGGVLAVVALADLSGMSKGEVERIWVPFVPWAVLATSALAVGPRALRSTRTWLAVQVACTLVIAVTIWSL
ncbi:MAG: hypothetical protein ACLPVY_06805 [Acidimicrobiia bacterium]